jgi:DNA repair protein RadC
MSRYAANGCDFAQRFSFTSAPLRGTIRRVGQNEDNKPRHHGEGHRQRLRERFERAGFAALAEHEVVELILTLCIPRSDVKLPAKKLLERFGSLRGILDASPADLRTVDGIGSVTPVALRVIREASALYLQQGIEGREVLNSSWKLEEFLRLRFAGQKVECVEVLHLDSGRRLLPQGIERLETGTVDSVTLAPRKLLESAIMKGSKSLVIAHNHPGGAPRFSGADIELTQQLRRASEALEIELIDHLLVSGDEVISMRNQGLFDTQEIPFRMVAEDQAPYRA